MSSPWVLPYPYAWNADRLPMEVASLRLSTGGFPAAEQHGREICIGRTAAQSTHVGTADVLLSWVEAQEAIPNTDDHPS